MGKGCHIWCHMNIHSAGAARLPAGGRKTACAIERYLRLITLLAALLVMCGCSGLLPARIGDIKNNPRSYADKTVTVSGEVTQTFSLVVMKYFTLRDGTGEITVVTQRPMPKEGERLTVKGTVHEAFSLGSETMLVIVEEPEKRSNG